MSEIRMPWAALPDLTVTIEYTIRVTCPVTPQANGDLQIACDNLPGDVAKPRIVISSGQTVVLRTECPSLRPRDTVTIPTPILSDF